jgi:hypothetical protein
MKWTSWCNLILGVWLFISPWLIGYATGIAAGNSLVVGIIIAIVAIVALSSYQAARGARWVNVVLGIWTIVSPWILSFSGRANVVTNDVIVGALVTIFALIGIGATRRMAAHA